jgi:hypothetical protein
MKGFMLTLALIASTAPALAPTQAFARTTNDLAPADRYFGQLQMSILGVRNSLHDLKQRIEAHPNESAQVYDKALLVEDSLRDWSQKFPNDPWIPKFVYSLAELYRTIDTEDARVRKNDALDWLVASYPASDYAKMGRM